MKIDVGSIIMKMLIEKGIKLVSWCWKKQPNYIILFILNTAITTGLLSYQFNRYDSQKQELAFQAYKKGQIDTVNLRDKMVSLLKDCDVSYYINVSNIFINQIDRVPKGSNVNALYNYNQQGKYAFTIGEVEMKNPSFCIANENGLSTRKTTCIVNAKYFNSFYQQTLYSDATLDSTISQLTLNQEPFTIDVNTLIKEQPFFKNIADNTDANLFGDVYFAITSYNSIPYSVIMITTSQGYNSACNINRIILELYKYQQNQFTALQKYANEM